jgi:xanthine dehydrogenase accessory factor
MPLVRLAQTLGFRTRVVDARRAFATEERFPTTDELIVAWPQGVLKADELGPQHCVVILSHDPKFDVPALQIALRSQAGYIGLIGSRATQVKRKAALREAGFGEAELARIHGPVGLDLGGREPAEIALAILAEIVAVRHGRRGGKLSEQGPTPT